MAGMAANCIGPRPQDQRGIVALLPTATRKIFAVLPDAITLSN
jgi:hypothetical protein